MKHERRRKLVKSANSTKRCPVLSSPKKSFPCPATPEDRESTAPKIPEEKVPDKTRFNPVRVQQISLWEAYQNRERAAQDWFNFMISNFGVIPDEIIVDRATYQLIFAYLYARGTAASGNWLDLHFTISYDLRFGRNDVILYDWITGAEIVYGGGSDVVQFTEKDIPKRPKDV